MKSTRSNRPSTRTRELNAMKIASLIDTPSELTDTCGQQDGRSC